MQTAKKSKGPMPARALALVAVPFAIAGLGFGGCGAWVAVAHQRAKSWVETPAVIQSVEFESGRQAAQPGHVDNTRKTVATYRYEFEGNSYTGNRVSFYLGGDSLGSFQRDVHRELSSHVSSGRPFRCFVNPHDPAESVLYRTVRWEMLLMICGVAALFGSGGICIGNEAIRTRRRQAAFAGGGRSTLSPWLSRADWAAGRIRPFDSTNAAPFAAILAAWWVIATLPLLVTLPEMVADAKSRWVWVALVPLAMAALAVAAAVYLYLRRRKFGDAVFEMDSVPGVIGGLLVGMVRVRARIDWTAGIRAKLICMSQTQTERGSEHEKSLWQDERFIAPREIRTKNEETSVPVRFAIPQLTRSTSLPGDATTIRWLLELTSRQPGIDFKTEFEVPVFRTAESTVAAESTVEPTPPLRDVERLYREAGITRAPLPGGVRFVFRMLRNPVSAIVIALIAGSLVTVTWLLVKAGALFIFPGVVGLLGLIFLLVALDLWLTRITVEASPKGLRIRGGWFGLGRTHHIPAEDIKELFVKQTMASGKHVWNSIFVVPKSGRRRTVASSIGSRLVEQAFLEDLNRALGRNENAA